MPRALKLPIPIKTNRGISYKKDKKDEVVISNANSEILKKIAALGDGNFIKTKDTNQAVDFVFENMKDLDKTLKEEQMYSDYEDQFQWFLGFALFFIFIDLALTQKKINFIRNNN